MSTLNKYIGLRLIPLPPLTRVGGVRVRLWSDEDIARLKELLPKIGNGRKTKKQLAIGSQQLAKAKKTAKAKAKTKTQPGAAVPH